MIVALLVRKILWHRKGKTRVYQWLQHVRAALPRLNCSERLDKDPCCQSVSVMQLQVRLCDVSEVAVFTQIRVMSAPSEWPAEALRLQQTQDKQAEMVLLQVCPSLLSRCGSLPRIDSSSV